MLTVTNAARSGRKGFAVSLKEDFQGALETCLADQRMHTEIQAWLDAECSEFEGLARASIARKLANAVMSRMRIAVKERLGYEAP